MDDKRVTLDKHEQFRLEFDLDTAVARLRKFEAIRAELDLYIEQLKDIEDSGGVDEEASKCRLHLQKQRSRADAYVATFKSYCEKLASALFDARVT